jgi:ATP-dependent DNA ligase
MGLEGGYSSCRMHYYALSFQRSFSNHTFFFHQESGKDSQDKKRNHIKGLLVAATDCEPQYITRLLQSKMRIGLAEKTVQMALGQAAVYSEKHSPPSKIQSPFEEVGAHFFYLKFYRNV